jgi:hypothetical protein
MRTWQPNIGHGSAHGKAVLDQTAFGDTQTFTGYASGVPGTVLSICDEMSDERTEDAIIWPTARFPR